MMLNLKTVSCVKTILRQFSQCFGLGIGLAASVLVFTHTATNEGVTKRPGLFFKS